MKMVFIGAAHEVTGSCTYLEVNGHKLLVDFGMEQGQDAFENAPIPCAPGDIEYVLLTHAHIDHSGLLPLLYAGGFRGEIHATQATVSLCGIMLRDSAHIQETEAEWQSRKAERRGEEPVQPLYTMEEAEGAVRLLYGHRYDERFTLCEGVEARFVDAGHLLGSASIEIWAHEQGETRKIVFSGDIGNLDQPLIRNPVYLEDADYAVMESTYGDRLHSRPENYVTALAKVLEETFDRGGSVIIPSFAVGRTQEMLYFFRQIKEQNLLRGHEHFPVFMDSPLAIEATEIFIQNQNSCYDEEARRLVQSGVNPLFFPDLRYAVTAEDSQRINADPHSKVIISASGMCDAGRIRHHLKHNLWQPENTILFVGYQARGTLGRALVEGASSVKLFGETVQAAAQICVLPGVSGHADRDGLTTWISHIHGVKRVFVNHGDAASADAFTAHLRRDLGLDAYAPYSGTEFDLLANEIIHEAAPQPVVKKPRVQSAAYQRLLDALARLTKLVQKSGGLANRDLSHFAEQIERISDKMEK